MPAALQPPSAMLFGEELIWKQPIDKLGQEGKGDLTDQVLMRSMLHYGCVAYMSSTEIHLPKKTGTGADVLGTHSGAYRTSPVAVMQVEVAEQPLRIRRIRHMLA